MRKYGWFLCSMTEKEILKLYHIQKITYNYIKDWIRSIIMFYSDLPQFGISRTSLSRNDSRSTMAKRRKSGRIGILDRRNDDCKMLLASPCCIWSWFAVHGTNASHLIESAIQQNPIFFPSATEKCLRMPMICPSLRLTNETDQLRDAWKKEKPAFSRISFSLPFLTASKRKRFSPVSLLQKNAFMKRLTEWRLHFKIKKMTLYETALVHTFFWWTAFFRSHGLVHLEQL